MQAAASQSLFWPQKDDENKTPSLGSKGVIGHSYTTDAQANHRSSFQSMPQTAALLRMSSTTKSAALELLTLRSALSHEGLVPEAAAAPLQVQRESADLQVMMHLQSKHSQTMTF